MKDWENPGVENELIEGGSLRKQKRESIIVERTDVPVEEGYPMILADDLYKLIPIGFLCFVLGYITAVILL